MSLAGGLTQRRITRRCSGLATLAAELHIVMRRPVHVAYVLQAAAQCKAMLDPKGGGALRFPVFAWAKTALRKFPYGHGQVYPGEGRVRAGHLREQARATLLVPASRRCSRLSISKGGREHAYGVCQGFARARRLKRSVASRFTGGSASRWHRSHGCLVLLFS